MKYYEWLGREIDKALKERNIKDIIVFEDFYPEDLFPELFMKKSGFSSIKDLLMAAGFSENSNEGIKKEDLDKYLYSQSFFSSWGKLINTAIEKYLKEQEKNKE